MKQTSSERVNKSMLNKFLNVTSQNQILNCNASTPCVPEGLFDSIEKEPYETS